MIDPNLVEHRVSAKGLQVYFGLDSKTIRRAKEKTFAPPKELRRRINDPEVIERLDRYMEDHSDQTWRFREVVKVRNRPEGEPQRILHTTFNQCFDDFLHQNEAWMFF